MGWFRERFPAPWAPGRLRRVLDSPWPDAVLAGLTPVLFLLFQALTGLLLALYYRPSWTEAHESVVRIAQDVPSGWLVRSAHVWSGHLLVVGSLVHLILVFGRGGAAAPREGNWILGIALLMLLFGSAFTGQMLPMDEEAVAGAQVASAYADSAAMGTILRGGAHVGPDMLGRMFAAHVLLLPALLAMLGAWHAGIAARHGIAPAPATRGPFLPRLGLHVLAMAALLATLAVAFPPGVGPKGDPSVTAPGVKPLWMFLPLYQALKWVPASLSGIVLAAPWILAAALPFLPRRAACVAGTLLLAAMIALGVAGALS